MPEIDTLRRSFKSHPLLWLLFTALLIALAVAIATPNYMHSRKAALEATLYGEHRENLQLAGFMSFDFENKQTGSNDAARKVRKTLALTLLVENPEQVSAGAEEIAEKLGGYTASMERTEYGANLARFSMVLRVPVAHLEHARNALKGLAKKVETEKMDAEDLTEQYVDMQATLRNLTAEETQYLGIMKRAASVKDTLEVATKLADVRQRIERTQGQFNLLSSQVELAAISVVLAPQTLAHGIDWRPLENSRIAFGEALQMLASYSDTVIAFIIKIPAIALWVLTLLAGFIYALRLGQWIWRVWLRRIVAPLRSKQVAG
jgi:hypothetical protein